MSSTRPKLVQEGTPIGSGGGATGTASLQGSSSLQSSTTTGSSKPKYRLVIGGEDSEHLPDDPDQYHDYKKFGYRGGGGRGRGGRHLLDYHRGGGGGRGRYHNDYRGGGRGGRYYDSYRGRGDPRDYGRDNYYSEYDYDNHNTYESRYDGGGGFYDGGGVGGGFHNGSGRRIIKNPKAQGLVTGRIVIGGGDESEERPDDGAAFHTLEALGNPSRPTMMDVEIIPQTYNEDLHQIERMEGVISLDAKEPLVVMDGANVAYAYADAMAGVSGGGKREPDYRGFRVAADYFLSVGVRVLIVLPAPWFRVKPSAGDYNKDNAMMMTEKVEILTELKEHGLLVAAPPRDDDDAYALTIARREHERSLQRGDGGGFVLSNDMFRDAMARDHHLEEWLSNGRISFAFCDLGTMNESGQKELDFIPNPRHPLVSDVERQRHAPTNF